MFRDIVYSVVLAILTYIGVALMFGAWPEL